MTVRDRSSEIRLIKDIDILVRDRYGDYRGGEPFSRICPQIFSLNDYQLKTVRNMLSMRSNAGSAKEGETGILALMNTIMNTTGKDRFMAMAERGKEIASDMTGPLSEKVKQAFTGPAVSISPRSQAPVTEELRETSPPKKRTKQPKGRNI